MFNNNKHTYFYYRYKVLKPNQQNPLHLYSEGDDVTSSLDGFFPIITAKAKHEEGENMYCLIEFYGRISQNAYEQFKNRV